MDGVKRFEETENKELSDFFSFFFPCPIEREKRTRRPSSGIDLVAFFFVLPLFQKQLKRDGNRAWKHVQRRRGNSDL